MAAMLRMLRKEFTILNSVISQRARLYQGYQSEQETKFGEQELYAKDVCVAPKICGWWSTERQCINVLADFARVALYLSTTSYLVIYASGL